MSYSRLAARGQLRTRLPVPYNHRESPVVLPLHLTVPLYHFSEWPSLPKEMNVVEVHEVVLQLDDELLASANRGYDGSPMLDRHLT